MPMLQYICAVKTAAVVATYTHKHLLEYQRSIPLLLHHSLFKVYTQVRYIMFWLLRADDFIFFQYRTQYNTFVDNSSNLFSYAFLTQALTNCLSASADFLDFLWWLDWTSELYRMVDLEMELVVVNWYLNLTHYSLLSYSPVGFPIINPETHMQLLMNCFNCA